MVDISAKETTTRVAIARGRVRMSAHTVDLIRRGENIKGDVLNTARLAGVLAAKRTAELIPLCHPLLLNHIDVDFQFDDELPGVLIEASVRTSGKTGAEMEALTAVSVAGLTIYDMCKAADKEMVLEDVRLVYKSGGKSGVYRAMDYAEQQRGEGEETN